MSVQYGALVVSCLYTVVLLVWRQNNVPLGSDIYTMWLWWSGLVCDGWIYMYSVALLSAV